MSVKIGENFIITRLSDGTLKVDGGMLFGVPKVRWEDYDYMKADRLNRVQTSVTALLVRAPGRTLLIDAGVGGKDLQTMRTDYGFTRSRLVGELRKLGLTPRNVDFVAFSNMRFYRSGGATKLDRDNLSVPTFRNATYLMQKAALEAAKSPNHRVRMSFHEYDLDCAPLEETDRIRYVKDGETIMTGVTAKLMDGVAKGNQVFFIRYGSEKVLYAGDVIPTQYHLNVDNVQADAEFPNMLVEQKSILIEQAVEEGWLVIFGRDPKCPAAYLYKKNGVVRARPKAI